MENSRIIKIGDDSYERLFSERDIDIRIGEISQLIKSDFSDQIQPPIVMMVLTGGLYFGIDLSQALDQLGLIHHIDTVGLKSYPSDGQGGLVEMISRPHADLSDRDIIVVEDVIDRGDTMNYLHEYLLSLSKAPRSISYCALLVKKNHGSLNFEINYHGFEIGPAWIVGYGMDANQSHRGLKEIFAKCS